MQRSVLAKRDSVADLLEQIRQQLSARVSELRPLVDEHARLERALQALDEPQSPPARTRPRAQKPRPPATARKRAPRGANRAAVLRAVEDRPGATSSDLAAVSGVKSSTLHALLKRLVNDGELQTQTLPTGRTGYAIGDRPAQTDPAPADDERPTSDADSTST
jgi:hypothetical protein